MSRSQTPLWGTWFGSWNAGLPARGAFLKLASHHSVLGSASLNQHPTVVNSIVTVNQVNISIVSSLIISMCDRAYVLSLYKAPLLSFGLILLH